MGSGGQLRQPLTRYRRAISIADLRIRRSTNARELAADVADYQTGTTGCTRPRWPLGESGSALRSMEQARAPWEGVVEPNNRSRAQALTLPRTPPQDFYLRLDTATPYLWVYDEDCSTSNCTLAKATQSLFKHNESSTYKDLGETGTVTYVSSSCSGWWGTDTVGITNGLEGDARSTQSTDTYQFGRCSCYGLCIELTLQSAAPAVM